MNYEFDAEDRNRVLCSMPKPEKSKPKKLRHDPLHQQIADSEQTGPLRKPKNKSGAAGGASGTPIASVPTVNSSLPGSGLFAGLNPKTNPAMKIADTVPLLKPNAAAAAAAAGAGGKQSKAAKHKPDSIGAAAAAAAALAVAGGSKRGGRGGARGGRGAPHVRNTKLMGEDGDDDDDEDEDDDGADGKDDAAARAVGLEAGDDDDDAGEGEDDDTKTQIISSKQSAKILKLAISQANESTFQTQTEKVLEAAAHDAKNEKLKKLAGGAAKSGGKDSKSAAAAGDSDAEDGDDADDAAGDDDDPTDVTLRPEDEKDLETFWPGAKNEQRTLGDHIMQALRAKERQQAAGGDSKDPFASSGVPFGGKPMDLVTKKLAPQVVEVYTAVGKYLHHYTSGKVPLAFKIIPTLKNWEEVLYLTTPDGWTPQAVSAATKVFASNLNPKMAQRFYNLVLLPRVRSDISAHKKLNYHLYQSLKKSIYKPAAFFRGVLLPLCEDGCTVREAVIFGSLLTKVTIPVLHASVFILKLLQMPYSGTSTFIMKTILNKKYNLPVKVIEQLVRYIVSFASDAREMPVIWHQNVLTFVQRYKNDLTAKHKAAIHHVITQKQKHKQISPEIDRELRAIEPSVDLTKPAAKSSAAAAAAAAVGGGKTFAAPKNAGGGSAAGKRMDLEN